jgi:hypothetical protein
MVADPIEELARTGEKLPPKLRAEVIALGPEAVPRLLDVLDDDLGSWPSIHAAELLMDLRATEAIEPLLDALTDTTFEDIVYNVIVTRLPELGAAVVEPALIRLDKEGAGNDGDDDTSDGLCELLANAGVKDERIFAAVREAFERDQSFGAGMLANYGDVRAAPLIEKAIAEFTPNFSSLLGKSDLVELLDAQERLGAVLSPELRERIDGWLAEWDARHRRTKEANAPLQRKKVGRNEPCPCGSGKKYKKCCLASDEAARPRVVAASGAALHDSAGRGPAKQMADYARPIIDATDGSFDAVQAALNMSMLFWNLAITPDDEERRDNLVDMALRLDEADRPEFVRTARMMIERHRAMFPEMHQ